MVGCQAAADLVVAPLGAPAHVRVEGVVDDRDLQWPHRQRPSDRDGQEAAEPQLGADDHQRLGERRELEALDGDARGPRAEERDLEHHARRRRGRRRGRARPRAGRRGDRGAPIGPPASSPCETPNSLAITPNRTAFVPIASRIVPAKIGRQVNGPSVRPAGEASMTTVDQQRRATRPRAREG